MLQKNIRIPSIAIVGAGYSGVSLAANIHRLAKTPIHIYLIGKLALFGKGVAYSTQNPLHLLNVRAKDMSAFNHDDMHFVNWLKMKNIHAQLGIENDELHDYFIPRKFYGDYLADILRAVLITSKSGCEVEAIHGEAISVEKNNEGIVLGLADGSIVKANLLVLAHGHIIPHAHFNTDNTVKIIQNPWDFEAYKEISQKSRVFIVGTGLTMIDAVIQLKSQNHEGKIMALSRHGLLSQVNLPETSHYQFDPMLFPISLKKLIKVIREEINMHAHQDEFHQSLFKALRLKANEVWSSFSFFEKKQLINHLMPYWEKFRHRVAPKISHSINIYINDKSLEILSGHIVEIINQRVVVRTRRHQELSAFQADYLINCTGPEKYDHKNLMPILDSLISQGYVLYNDLHLGINVSKSGAVIDRFGVESRTMYVLGPPRKGVLIETTAVKEIRVQSEELAKHCLNNLY